jgi:hypothetical protein
VPWLTTAAEFPEFIGETTVLVMKCLGVWRITRPVNSRNIGSRGLCGAAIISCRDTLVGMAVGLSWHQYNTTVGTQLCELREIDGIIRVTTQMLGGIRRGGRYGLTIGLATLSVEIAENADESSIRGSITRLVGSQLPVCVSRISRAPELGL